MATNPYFTQYHTQRFSLIGSPQQRDGHASKDQRFINMYPELIRSPISDGKKYYLKKRPGVANFQTLPAGNSQGMFFWNNTYYYVIAGTVYAGGVSIGTVATTTGLVGFCEYRDDTIDELFMCDGTKGYVIHMDNSMTTISDPNFPTGHIPTPVFLDGYIFLAVAGTQTIHNSALQNPLSWPTGNFIDAEMFPDNIQNLAKVQNYIAVIGTQSIEWMYDNANATGSPLQRTPQAVTQFGTPAPASVNQTEKELILVGETGNGGRTVWVIDGFQPAEIGNEPVREALDAEGASLANATANTIQCAGHKWYILNLALNRRTFVYDFDEKMWHEWSTVANDFFEYRFATDSGNGTVVWLGFQGGNSVTMSPDNYTDLGVSFTCTAITVKIDFDTIKRKRFYRLSLIGDAPNANNNVPITVSWSDDDYNTFVGNVTLNLNGSYPTINQLGYARRRAFQFVYTQPYPLRLESFEVDVIQEVRR